MKKLIYLKFNPEDGKTVIDRVADDHVLFNTEVPEEEKQYYSVVAIQGSDLDVSHILNKLFPEDDPTVDISVFTNAH